MVHTTKYIIFVIDYNKEDKMISFIKKDKRKYDIVSEKADGKIDNHIASLDLVFSPATNKFDKIVEFVEDCSKTLGDEFDIWFTSYLTEYIESNYNSAIVKRNIPELKRIADTYLEACNINFENYINKSKISKNSIFFDAEEIVDYSRSIDCWLTGS